MHFKKQLSVDVGCRGRVAAHHETPRGGVGGRLAGGSRSPLGLTCSALPDASRFFPPVLSSRFFNLFCRPAGAPSPSRSHPVLSPGRSCLSLFNDAEPGGGLHLIMDQPRALIGGETQLGTRSTLLMSLRGGEGGRRRGREGRLRPRLGTTTTPGVTVARHSRGSMIYIWDQPFFYQSLQSIVFLHNRLLKYMTLKPS